MPGLFDTLQVRAITLRNRIVMAPMGQGSATADGAARDWHRVHYGARAVGGVGLIIVEVTAVESRGRSGEHGLGLWDDAQIDPLARVTSFCSAHGATIGIQLGHSGRKAGSAHQGHWSEEIVGPSAVPFDAGWRVPRALSTREIADIVQAFAQAARRALAAGFQVVELHAAHGYLLSSFLSPLANQAPTTTAATSSAGRASPAKP